MSDSTTQSTTPDLEPDDAAAADLGFGKGGVPIALLLFYLSFLGFFTWYTLEYQLPAFLDEGPGASESAAEGDAEGGDSGSGGDDGAGD